LVRCKLAAELSRAGFFFGTYAWRRITSGRSAWFSRRAAAALVVAARIVLPRPLRGSVEEIVRKSFEGRHG